MASIHLKARMLNLPARLDISDPSMKMLKSYDDYQTGRISEDELGRKVRLSHNSRKSMVDTIVKCVQYRFGHPEEQNHCVEIAKAMGEMLKMKDQPPESLVFHFMGLPNEIRRMVENYYLDSYMQPGPTTIVPAKKKGRGRCNCPNPVEARKLEFLNFPLARTCKMVKDEFMTNFYQKYLFSFPCACEMGYHLEHNPALQVAVRHLSFNWIGPRAGTSISLLKKMELYSLTVRISKETGQHLSAREAEFRHYFQPKRGYMNCLTETLGMDELLDLRGIRTVMVIANALSKPRPEAERHGLERLLRDKVTKPRENNNN